MLCVHCACTSCTGRVWVFVCPTVYVFCGVCVTLLSSCLHFFECFVHISSVCPALARIFSSFIHRFKSIIICWINSRIGITPTIAYTLQLFILLLLFFLSLLRNHHRIRVCHWRKEKHVAECVRFEREFSAVLHLHSDKEGIDSTQTHHKWKPTSITYSHYRYYTNRMMIFFWTHIPFVPYDVRVCVRALCIRFLFHSIFHL